MDREVPKPGEEKMKNTPIHPVSLLCIQTFEGCASSKLLFFFFRTDGGGIFNRIFVLEARKSERQTLAQMLYFPFIFFMFGVITGNAL